jgi:hypothetical protein
MNNGGSMSKDVKKVNIRSNNSFFYKQEEKIYLFIIFVIPIIYFWQALSPSNILFGSDWMSAGYALRNFVYYSVKHFHQFPLWNPYVFGGMPVIDAFYGDLFYFTTLFRMFIPTHIVWSYSFILHIMIAGFSTYFLLKEMGISKKSSLIGAIVYMTGGCIISQVYPGHDGKVCTSSYLPLLILMTLKAVRTEKFVYFMLFALFYSFSVLGGHLQISYAFGVIYFITVVIYIINLLKRDAKKGKKQLLFFLITALVFLGLIACQYIPVLSYIKYAVRGASRGYAFSTSWALPTSELTDLIVPQFSGILNNYWGENFFKLDNHYMGILPVLSLVFLFYYRKKWNIYIKYFIITGVLGILLSLGGHTPFYRIIYLIPGFQKFRAPSMFFILVHLSFSILMAFVIQFISDDNEIKKLRKFIYWLMGILTLIFLIVIGTQSGIYSALYNHFRSSYIGLMPQQQVLQKMEIFKRNFPTFISGLTFNFILIIIFSAIFVFLKREKKNYSNYIFMALIVVVFIDTYRINKNYIKTMPFREFIKKSSIVSYLSDKGDIGRILPLYWDHSGDDYLMQYQLESVGGAGSNQLKTYQKLIGAEHTVMFNPTGLLDDNVSSLVNAKYIIAPVLPEDYSRYPIQTQNLIKSLRDFIDNDSLKQRIATIENYNIYKNDRSLERFSMIYNVRGVENDEEAITILKNPLFRVGDSAIVAGDLNIKEDGKGKIDVIKYTPNYIELNVNTTKRGLLLVLNNYYPAWKVRIDGEPVKLYRANYSFQGIDVKPGEHIVKIYFKSKAEHIGFLISLLTLIFVFATIIFEIKMKKSVRR